MNAPARIESDAPIPEAEVLRMWVCLSAYRLKRARNVGEIEWVPGPRGTPYYQPSAVVTFINEVLKKPCRAPEKPRSLNSADNGSPETEQAPSTIDSGLTPDLAAHVGRALAQQI